MIDQDAIRESLAARAAELTRQLSARVAANLSRGVLNARTGQLASSITSGVEDEGFALEGFVASEGVPYAAILEFGGKTAAHEIAAVKAKALAFAGSAGLSFAKSVHHPGSVIPAFGYLGHALEEMHAQIVTDLKQSVLDALT